MDTAGAAAGPRSGRPEFGEAGRPRGGAFRGRTRRHGRANRRGLVSYQAGWRASWRANLLASKLAG